MSPLDELRAMLDGAAALDLLAIDPEVTVIDPDPRARTVPGIGRVVEPPITGVPATSRRRPRVVVYRHAPGEWRAELVEPADDGLAEPEPVGRFGTQHEAITRGITAARFVAAGVPWRAEQ